MSKAESEISTQALGKSVAVQHPNRQGTPGEDSGDAEALSLSLSLSHSLSLSRSLSLSLSLFPSLSFSTNYTPHPRFCSGLWNTYRCIHSSLNVHTSLDQTRGLDGRCSISVSLWRCLSLDGNYSPQNAFALTSTQKPWQMKLSLTDTVYVTKVDGKANRVPGGARWCNCCWLIFPHWCERSAHHANIIPTTQKSYTGLLGVEDCWMKFWWHAKFERNKQMIDISMHVIAIAVCIPRRLLTDWVSAVWD